MITKDELFDKLYTLLDDNKAKHNRKLKLLETSLTMDGDRDYHLGYDQAIRDVINKIVELLDQAAL